MAGLQLAEDFIQCEMIEGFLVIFDHFHCYLFYSFFNRNYVLNLSGAKLTRFLTSEFRIILGIRVLSVIRTAASEAVHCIAKTVLHLKKLVRKN